MRARVWVIVVLLVVLPVVTGIVSFNQTKRYEATADVVQNDNSLASQVIGVTLAATFEDQQRDLATQSQAARTPAVARRTLALVPSSAWSPAEFLAHSKVDVQPDANIISMSVNSPNASQAVALTNAYAAAFVGRARRTAAAQIAGVRKRIRTHLDALAAQISSAPSAVKPEIKRQYDSLLSKDGQLQTLQTLPPTNLTVLRQSSGASQVAPRPVRNIALAIALALVLGLGYALIRAALDTRVSNTDELASTLGVPIVGRLPIPPAVTENGADPHLTASGGHLAEGLAMARNSLMVGPDWPARGVIMVASAAQGEGKTSISLGLALSLARTGRRVTVVDGDLRRAMMHRMLRLERTPGLSNVLAGTSSLDEALRHVPVSVIEGDEESGNHGGVELTVLPAGDLVPAPGDLLSLPSTGELLHRLVDFSDVVIVDTPPLLLVSDALALGGMVDGIVVVAAVNKLKRPAAKELARMLDDCSAPKLGLVTTGAAEGDREYQYTGGYRYYAATPS